MDRLKKVAEAATWFMERCDATKLALHKMRNTAQHVEVIALIDETRNFVRLVSIFANDVHNALNDETEVKEEN